MMDTEIDTSVETLRQIVLANFDRLEWRHHGIGVLQAYVFERTEPEIRVHIWHPSLTSQGIDESGDLHDHRFDLRSTVLFGRINETYFGVPTLDDHGKWSMYVVQDDKQLAPLPGRFSAGGQDFSYPAGVTYSHPRGTFHRTRFSELAVTLCVLSDKQGLARLLVPRGHEPINAFGRAADQDAQLQLISQARESLRDFH